MMVQMHGHTVTLPVVLGDVAVRHIERKDWERNIALYMCEVTMKYFGGPRLTAEQRRDGLLSYRPSINALTIADTATDRVIGACGVLTHNGEVYILLEKEHCGRGIARIVVPTLVQLARQEGLRPHGCVHSDNKASLTMLERLGWTRVGECESKSEWQHGHLRFEPPSTP